MSIGSISESEPQQVLLENIPPLVKILQDDFITVFVLGSSGTKRSLKSGKERGIRACGLDFAVRPAACYVTRHEINGLILSDVRFRHKGKRFKLEVPPNDYEV